MRNKHWAEIIVFKLSDDFLLDTYNLVVEAFEERRDEAWRQPMLGK